MLAASDMVPVQYPLTFDEGVAGSADFAVSLDLLIDQATLIVFPKGDYLAASPLQYVCSIVSNTIKVQMPAADTDSLGAGRHAYQLDVRSGTDIIRLARGELFITPGVRVTFV
jgi:hypothetical protein